MRFSKKDFLRLFLFLFMFLFILLSPLASFAAVVVEWEPTGKPETTRDLKCADVKVSHTNKDKIYALCYLGERPILLKSTDRGVSWTELINAGNSWTYEDPGGTKYFAMFGIEIDPTNDEVVYAYGGVEGTNYYGGVWKSQNGGTDWLQVYGKSSGTLLPNSFTNGFKIAPDNSNYLYRWVRPNFPRTGLNKVLSVSETAGVTWSDRLAGIELPAGSGIFDLDIHPTNESVIVFSQGWYAKSAKPLTAEAGIYISTNEGQSFTIAVSYEVGCLKNENSSAEDGKVPVINSVRINPGDPAVIRGIKAVGNWFADPPYTQAGVQRITSGEVYLSSDFGQTWTTKEFLTSEMYDAQIWILASLAFAMTDPNDFNRVFYIQNGHWQTTDNGDTWQKLNFNIGSVSVPYTYVTPKIEFSRTEVGPNMGVIYLPQAIYPPGSSDLARHQYYGSSLFDWEDISGPMDRFIYSSGVKAFPLVPGTMMARGNLPSQNFRLDNYGAESKLITGFGLGFFFLDPKNKGVGYRTTVARYLRKTYDFFETNETAFTLELNMRWREIAFDPTNTETIYASIGSATPEGYPYTGIRKSLDGGQSWTPIGSTGSAESPTILVVDPISPEVLYKAGALDETSPNNFGVFKSTDGGVNWFDIDDLDTYGSGLYNQYPMLLTASAIAVDPTDNRIIYIGTGDFDFEGYLFFTTNGGSTWLPRTNIASDMWVREVKLSPDNPKRCYVDAQRTNSIVNPLTAGYYGIVARWINGVESGLSAISSGIEDELGNKIPIFGIDVDGKTDGIIYAATQNGVFKGIDYNYMQSPSIEVLSPPYGFNLDSFPMRVYGNYFLETVNKVTITGPSAQTEDLTIANGGIQSVSPTLIIVRVPAGLELGTWEAKVEVQRDAGTFTSDTATFEIIDQSSEGPQFKNVKFDGLSYVEEFAPMPVQRGPQVIARIEDPDGINDKGFSYVWINKATLGRREVTDEAEFDYDEISSTEGTVTFYVDPPFDPGSYDFIITAHDAATSEVLPDGNPNIWAGILEVEVGPVRVIGNILSYPTVFKPLKEGESTIAYNLSRSADVSVYIYDVAGQIVLTKKFASGLNGGRAGYNDFTWNGISDFGSYIGNGIYVIKITSGNKGIGTGKLVVFD